MQRRKVDLPPPDGPIITTTSPLRISVEMPFSTSSRPKHFFRFSILSSVSPIFFSVGVYYTIFFVIRGS